MEHFEPLLLLEHFSKSLSTAILIHFVYQKSQESTFFVCGWGGGGGGGKKELKKHHPSLSSSKHRDVQRLRFLAEQVRKRRFFLGDFWCFKDHIIFLVVLGGSVRWLLWVGCYGLVINFVDEKKIAFCRLCHQIIGGAFKHFF